jgi:serine/threonine protein kinase
LTPERWTQIEELFLRAIECDESQRDLLLQQACEGDLELRRNVEALLSSDSSARNRVQAVVDSEVRDFGFSMVGEVVSHYRILDTLGGGGMGLVYRAEDIKLGRQVAVKFLPEESANNPVALARFEREARAASALEHPNICPIYEFGEHLGQSFLVMQLLEGQTLRELLESRKNTTRTGSASKSRSSGALPVDRTLELGIQIADGLEAAHQKGIIHRDIKPANIFVTAQGEAKILDFGLAKLNRGPVDEDDKPERTWPSVSKIEHKTGLPETPDPLLSRTGLAMGTAGYMSPEQARGEKLDARSDIFSFGLVLYEMATGQRAFAKETGPILLAAILNETPMLVRKLNPKVPYKLELIINKTLEKERTARYKSASEVRADLKNVKREMEPKRRWGSVGVFILLLITSAALWFFRREQLTVQTRPEPKLRQLTVNSFENRVTNGAISPDGKYLVYADTNGMYTKDIETGETRTVPEPVELKKKDVEWDIPPTAWFRDNTRFVSNAHPANESPGDWSSLTTSVWVFSRVSGTPHQLRDKAYAWSVSPDGSLISFGANKGTFGDREVWLMDPNGEHARKLYDADADDSICCLTWSPDEQRVMYGKADHSGGGTLINRDLKGGPPTTIFTSSEMNKVNDAVWLPDGRLIYSLTEAPGSFSGTCNYWTMQLDSHTGGLIAKPRRLTNWTGGFCMDGTSMTADGKKLAFLKSAPHLTSYMAEWPAGGKRALKLRHFPLSESSDGVADWTVDSKEVILVSSRAGNFGIYKQALKEETAEPLVTEGYGRNPHATPDGKWLLYLGPSENGVAWPATTPQPVMRVPITGGPSQRLFTARRHAFITCAKSPSHLCVIGEPTEDGKQMTVTAIDFLKGRGPELFRFPLPANDDTWFLDLSPDGRRVAATQTQAGPIYILSLSGQVLQQVRLKGWSNLLELTWAADGKALFVTARIRNGEELLHVDLQGHVHALWESTGGTLETSAIPSPDGHYLAIQSWTTSGNVWMMEDF